MMTGTAWIPSWLGWAACVVYVVVIAVHLRHVVGATAQGRFWHSAHLLMAGGMIVMFLPTSTMIVSSGVGVMVFAVAALMMAAFTASETVRGGVRGAIVAVTTVDLAAMAYMFTSAAMDHRWLTLLAAAWFAVQAVAWTSGHLSALVDRSPVGREFAGRVRAPRDASTVAASPSSDTLRRTLPAPVWRASGHDLSIRLTLSAMAVGMAYMFLAMALGSGAMGPMGGM